ncbi:MAG: hypothetical protein HY701_10975 [Gemmatimonadetes bacterium]|nr:hypothetical protein [Gemmatimonadota bacterium]
MPRRRAALLGLILTPLTISGAPRQRPDAPERLVFHNVSKASGLATLPSVGFGVVFADHDNDGDLDLAIVNGHVIDNVAMFRSGARHAQKRLLLENTGAGRFRNASPQSGPGFAGEKGPAGGRKWCKTWRPINWP